MTPQSRPPRPFWLNVLIIVGAVSAVGYLLSLFTSVLMSNVYFIAAVICLVIATVPIFGEVGGNARTSIRARREGKVAREVIRAQEKAGKYSAGTRITFLFGASGFLCFLLAFLPL